MPAPHLPSLKIAIVGSGAVGCLYGAKLATGGHAVHFLMRRDLARVQVHGLRILSPDGDLVLPEVRAHGTTAEIGCCDLVIVAIKATDNEALADLIPPLLGESTQILTLQNGLGNEDHLAKLFGEERILGGLCFVCINRTAPGVIEHYSQGTIVLGEFRRAPRDRTRDLVSELQRCGIDCQLSENLETARWQKLVWNVPFNGVAIVGGGVDVSVILAEPSLNTLARELMIEIIGIAQSLGHDIPLGFIEDQFAKTAQMGPYKPSSLLDYLANRPVEVQAIWGEAYRQGKAAKTPVGHLETLYLLLNTLCKQHV